MHWVLEDRFDHDPKYRELKETLKRFDISHSLVKVVPFTDDGFTTLEGYDLNKLIPEINSDSLILHNLSVFCYGSYTLSKIMHKHFTPGAFISPMLGINNLLEHYGNEMFNNDMVIAPIRDLDTDLPEFFARPVEDTKSFCGGIMKNAEFKEWKQKIIDAALIPENYSTITPYTMAVIAKIKPIHQEVRFFIVDRKIATYSQYKSGDSVIYSPHVDQYVIDYVNEMLKVWTPDRCFCMDIAITDGIPKILETNSINSSGLYAIDIQKFVMAVEDCQNVLKFNVDVGRIPEKRCNFETSSGEITNIN